MGIMLEIVVPEEVFSRRIQPFGFALAEVSWRVKMFTHDGVVLSALSLEEPKVIVAVSFWPHQEVARRYFKGTFTVSLCAPDGSPGRVRLQVRLDAATVDELFTAATLLNPHPDHRSVRRAKRQFADFLRASMPEALVTWSPAHYWWEEPGEVGHGMPVRVG